MQELILPRCDDMHVHLRDGQALSRTVVDSSAWCARALVMPNLSPAVDSLEALAGYRERILAACPDGRDFIPLMTLYCSDNLTARMIYQAKAQGVVAVKWYPQGVTTNSAQGVAAVEGLYPVLEAMQEVGLLFLIHGEVSDPAVDIFDRESVFLDRVLIPMRRRFPALKMVLEHITTTDAAHYVLSEKENLAATITPQHLLFTRNQLLVGGVKPHYYCLPILKTETDRQALIEAATSGDPRFFLGTDSAPHSRSDKESACGCAGCYSALHAPALYAAVFDRAGALDKLEDFACRFGARYYGLSQNGGTIVLRRETNVIPAELPYGGADVVPLMAGHAWPWRLV